MKVKKHKVKLSLRRLRKASEFKEDMVSKISEFLEIPGELVGNNTKITLVANRYLYLEGKYKIADYYNYYIRIITEKYAINLSGKDSAVTAVFDMRSAESSILNGAEYGIEASIITTIVLALALGVLLISFRHRVLLCKKELLAGQMSKRAG